MAKVSHQLQDSDQGRESDRLFIRTKARIRQLQAGIAKVCGQQQDPRPGKTQGSITCYTSSAIVGYEGLNTVT